MATVTDKPEVSIEHVELRRLGSKDLDRIRLTRRPYPESLPHHADLFLVANALGVAAWIAPALDALQFAPTASLRQAYAADSYDQALAIVTRATRSVKLPLANIHHLALASTGDILVAAGNTLVGVDAASLASGSATELFRADLLSSSDDDTISHLYPNPNPTSDPSLHLLLALTASGTLHILNLAANGTLLRSISGQSITAAAWSPKGKQLVYATANRALTRIDPLSGKIAGTHPACPPLAEYDPFENDTCKVVGLVWTDPLAIAVLSISCEEDPMFCTAVLNWKSNAYVVSEPTAPFPANAPLKSPHTYTRSVPLYPGAPNLTIAASTSSLETHTLCTATDPDDSNPSPHFCAVLLNENTRAVLPNDDDTEHVPVGLAVDFTSSESLPPLTPDDPRRVPAAPIVWIMTDVGEVVGWHVYEMESAKQRKAYEGMVEPVVKSVEDLDKLAGEAKPSGGPPPPPPPPPPGPADKPIKVAPTSTVFTAAPALAASPFAFTSTKALEPGKPLFGAGASATKPFTAFAGAGAATSFGAFGSAASAPKDESDTANTPFSFGSGAPSLTAAAAAKDAAASKSATEGAKQFAFGGGSLASLGSSAEVKAKPAVSSFEFGAAAPGAARLFEPKQVAGSPAPAKPAGLAAGGFRFTAPSTSPPKIEAGGKRKAEDQQAPGAEDEKEHDEEEQQQEEEEQDEEGQDGYESESESESEESDQEQVPPPAPAPAAPQTRPRLVQRFKIQSEDADAEPDAPRQPTTPAHPSTSSSRATPRALQIPTFTPSKSTAASGLASVTTMCTNMAGTLDLLHAKRREIALRMKDHLSVMDAWDDRVADVKGASVAVKEWQADVDSALSRALIVKDAVDRTRAKVGEIQELIQQLNNPEAAGGIGEELGPEQVEGRQRIMAGLNKVRTRLRQLEAFAAQQAADEKERRRGKTKEMAAEAQEARVSLHSLHLAFKRMHEAIEARAEGVESLVLTMQMMNLVDAQHKAGAAAADVAGGEPTILDAPTVVLASGLPSAAKTESKPQPKVPGFRVLLNKYRRPVDSAAKCIESTLPVGVGWRCTQCKVRNARLAPQCAKCSAPKTIERAPLPDPEPEPVIVPSPQKPMNFTVPPPVTTPAGLHLRKEPRQPVAQTIESPAAPVPGLDDTEPAHDDPTPTKKRTKRGKPNPDAAVVQDPSPKSGGRSRTSSSGKPIGSKPKSLSQSSLVPSGGFSMSFAEPSKPDVTPPPPPAAAAAPTGGFKFTKPAGWTCDACLVPNKEDATKCASCETAKPGAKPAALAFQPPAPAVTTTATGGFTLPFAKPAGWTCDSCMVPNKEEATKCASCETAKPGAKPAPAAFQPPAPAATGGFKLQFAKPAGWTCGSCLVPNKDEATKCASCETVKPGAKPASAATAAPPAFVPPSTTATSSSSSSGGDKPAPALPPSGTGFTFGGKPSTGAGFGAFSFGAPALAKDADATAPAMLAFGCFPPTDAGLPGSLTAPPIVPFGFKPPTAETKSPLPGAKQDDKRSRSPSPASKPASPPKPSTPPPTSTRSASPLAKPSTSSGAQQARAASPPRTPTPGASVATAAGTSVSESARDDDEFVQIAGFETMGESLMLGGSLILLENETTPESAGMDEDIPDNGNGGGGGTGTGGDDAMDEAIDNSNDAFSGFSLGQQSAPASVNSMFGGFGGQAQQQQQQQQQQQPREQGASAFGWKPQGTFAGAAGSKPSAFGPVSTGGGAFGGAISRAQSAFGGAGNPSQSAFGGFGATSPAPTNAFGGGATSAGPAFGQPAALGGGGAPAFGQSSGLGGSSVGFGQPSALGPGAAFAQSSSLGAGAPAFGRPSGFGAAVTTGGAPAFGATSGFGAAAASTGFGAFASANQQQQQPSGGFGAFAGQSPQRVGFGALASGSSGQVTFGSPVAPNQQQQQQQQQPAQPQTTPSRTGLFGFSGHRG